MVVACLALAIALSGAGYAAVVLPRNSVGTAQLKRGAVHTSDLYGSAVTYGKLSYSVKSALNDWPSASVHSAYGYSPLNGNGTASAYCGYGEKAVGGGVDTGYIDSSEQIWVASSAPSISGTSWTATVSNANPSIGTSFTVRVICADLN